MRGAIVGRQFFSGTRNASSARPNLDVRTRPPIRVISQPFGFESYPRLHQILNVYAGLSVNQPAWHAKEVEILEPGSISEPTSSEPPYVAAPGSIEEQFLNASELPVESSAPAEPEIYSAEERRMSLCEIIRLRKTAA